MPSPYSPKTLSWSALAAFACLGGVAAFSGDIDQPFLQDVQDEFVIGETFPDRTSESEHVENIAAIGVTDTGDVVAAVTTHLTNVLLAEYDGERWTLARRLLDNVTKTPTHGATAQKSWRVGHGDTDSLYVAAALTPDGKQLVATEKGAVYFDKQSIFTTQERIGSVAANASGAIAIGTAEALWFRADASAEFARLYPHAGDYSWAPRNVGAVTFESGGNLWFGSDQGAGMRDVATGDWVLYTGAEGLPYNRFTCAAAGPNGEVWFGTERGALRIENGKWAYRASLRWLPDDHVNDVAVDRDGTAWIATPKGISRIKRRAMTLAEKEEYFQEQVETRHNRDGFTTDWQLTKRGDVSTAVPKITDNDGEYTSMYGSAMALKFAVTGDAKAKKLAVRSFEACKSLSDVVPDTMEGFVARVKIPIDWHEPVNEQYGPEYNAAYRADDPFWKLITPRFVKSEDGKYLWKNDTSSDELSGHYFFYGIYYDLVAKTEEERAPVRDVVRKITDHLIRNGFNLIDHDGKPTRWARFGPDYIDTYQGWDQRGLNSVMMLAILSIAEHITGDSAYGEVARSLRDEHAYHINTMVARPTFPPENVVPWDNTMALFALYPLFQYETDPELLILYRIAIEHAWLFMSRQANPLWSYLYAACGQRFVQLAKEGYFANAFPDGGPYAERQAARFAEYDYARGHALRTLRGLPLELIGWHMENSHRLDVQLDPTPAQVPGYGWSRVDGYALPVEERAHVRQDRDGFAIDSSEGDGWTEHEGTFFLLPYWLARHHGLLN